jgi:biopolymer transport protein ExbD
MRGFVGLAVATLLLGFGCQNAREAPAQVVVTIGPTGTINWDGEVVSFEELEKRVAEAAQREPKPHIVTRSDGDLDRQDPEELALTFRVVELVTRSGMGKVGIIMHPPT